MEQRRSAVGAEAEEDTDRCEGDPREQAAGTGRSRPRDEEGNRDQVDGSKADEGECGEPEPSREEPRRLWLVCLRGPRQHGSRKRLPDDVADRERDDRGNEIEVGARRRAEDGRDQQYLTEGASAFDEAAAEEREPDERRRSLGEDPSFRPGFHVRI